MDVRTSVFATFRLDAQTSARSRSRVAALLLDEPGERVVAAAWQLVGRGDGSRADAAPWGGLALLTNRRLMLYEYALSDDAMTNRDVENLVNVALTKRAETRNDIGQTIGSILWVGPALLFSRADGVFVLGWDGGVSTACACGVGGGAELALSAATEDALLLFLDAADAGGAENGNATNATTTTRNGNGASGNTRFPDFPNAVPFFRPVSAADALAIGWGSLIAAKRTSDGRVSDGLTLVARRAVASAFARHDASRVSFAALAHVARSLALPGLAANVASRATHLHATERAQFLVAARRSGGTRDNPHVSQLGNRPRGTSRGGPCGDRRGARRPGCRDGLFFSVGSVRRVRSRRLRRRCQRRVRRREFGVRRVRGYGHDRARAAGGVRRGRRGRRYPRRCSRRYSRRVPDRRLVDGAGARRPARRAARAAASAASGATRTPAGRS